jgi:hypothetical protein
MAANLFEIAALKLEAATELNRLEARGTLRIALKAAGLDAGALTLAQLRVVLDKVLPGELETRDIADSAAVCSAVLSEVERVTPDSGDAAATDSDEIFRRLGGA